VYSDINFILLGIALERIEGCGIYDMKPGEGFTFSPPVDQTAATEHYTWRGRVMRGEVHDENAFALQGAGHAGLFGTVEAVLGFARRLLQRDAERAQHIKVLRTPLSPTRAHGWEIAHEGWFGRTICSPSTIGHTGFTGTGLWIDFEAGRAWTLLTNRVHPSRPAESGIAELPKNVGTKICEGV
jgi:CubicO group peptidase (beta-lactamase class C family)